MAHFWVLVWAQAMLYLDLGFTLKVFARLAWQMALQVSISRHFTKFSKMDSEKNPWKSFTDFKIP